ncbi:MAG: fimbria major subunit [Muribaculaceae bacterium]|nr:fimbria major subunit [Muribaculaceae bacterium]
MDYKDGSELGNSTYQVIFEDNANGEPDLEKPIIDIYLNKMCLVNMNRSFYYLKRVSNNGLDTGAPEKDVTFNPEASKATYGWQLCGPEKPWYINADGSVITGENNSVINGNYVVDAWAEVKKTFADQFEDDAETYEFPYLTYCNYPFFNPNGILDDNTTQGSNDDDERWFVSQITDVLKGDSDNWNKKEYHVWRYLTENTIPGPNDNQVNGITTGVVFKGKMQIDKKAEPKELPENKYSADYFSIKAYNELLEAINKTSAPNVAEDAILYSIGGDVYAGWDNIRMAAIYSSISISLSPDQTEVIVDWNRENSLYQAIFGGGGTGYSFKATVKELLGGTIGKDDEDSQLKEVVYTDEKPIDPESPAALWTKWNEAGRPTQSDQDDYQTIIDFKKAATGNDITIYERSTDNVDGSGYYCYYYYWNRHNNNGNDGVMGPMEFAVVRNNVYKLSVTEINKLGHPRVPLNDPDSPTPKTPDEKENVYITVDAKVLPWVVRVNDIKF